MSNTLLDSQYTFELVDGVTRQSVRYPNRYGIVIAADLYLPVAFDPASSYSAVVIGTPYGAVKEQAAGVHAQEMARRGFVAVAFDPSYNGDSSGEPRHISSPEIFAEDFSAGVDFLGTREYVNRDKIAAIGVCGSGSFVLGAAAVDPRIKAVVTVSMYDITRMQRHGFHDTVTDEDRRSTLATLAEQRWNDFGNTEPELTGRGAPLEVDENTDPISREFHEYYATPVGFHPNSITAFTKTSTPAFVNAASLANITDISPRPILFVYGDQAHSRYFSEDAYQAAAEPKQQIAVPGTGHVDLYWKTDLIPGDEIAAFINNNI